MGTFVSFFVKKQIVQEIGLPISEFFIWADDIEYSRRVSLKYPSYLVNNSIVIHKSKNNIGSNIVEDSIDNLKRYSYAYRNERYVYKREGIVGILYYKLKCFLHQMRIVKSNMSKEEKRKKIDVIRNAVNEGKRFKPNIEFVEKYQDNSINESIERNKFKVPMNKIKQDGIEKTPKTRRKTQQSGKEKE